MSTVNIHHCFREITLNLASLNALTKQQKIADYKQTLSAAKKVQQKVLANIRTIDEYSRSLNKNNPDDQAQIREIKAHLDLMRKIEKATEYGLSNLKVHFPEKIEEIEKAVQSFTNVKIALKKTGKIAYELPVDLVKREKDFHRNLTPKNVAQLVGDAYLEKLHDSHGQKLEGNWFETISDFLISGLDYLPYIHPEAFPLEQRDKWEKIKADLEILGRLDQEIQEVFHQADHPSFLQKFAALTASITQTIENILPGDSLLLPWGWTAKNTSGHAILAEFKNTGNGMLIRIYNTGAGTEDHDPGDKNGKSYVNTVREYRLTMADLKNDKIISRMLESRVVPGNSKIMQDAEEYTAAELYHILEPYAVSISTGEQSWMKSQLSGTCALRCVLAYINYKTGGDYKLFKSLLERTSIKALLDNPELRTDSDLCRMLIARTNANMFRQELKKSSVDAEVVKELKRLERKYKSIYKKIASKNAAIRTHVPITTPKTDLAVEVVNASKKEKEKSYRPLNYPNLLKWVDNYRLTPLELNENLANIIAYVNEDCHVDAVDKETRAFESKYAKYNNLCVDFTLHLGRILTNPALAQEKALFLQALRQSGKDNCEKFLENIEKMTDILVQFKPGNPAQSLALASATAAVYQIGCVLDDLSGFKGNERLDAYSFTMPALEAFDNNKNPAAQLLNLVWEQDLKNLLEYYRKAFKTHHNDFCDLKNNFTVEPGPGYLTPDVDAPDYHYYKAHTKRRKDWKETDEAYHSWQKKLHYQGTKEHFRTMDTFYKIPLQYKSLFNSIYRTNHVSPFASAFSGAEFFAIVPFKAEKMKPVLDSSTLNLTFEYREIILDARQPDVNIQARTKQNLDKHWDQPESVKKLALELLNPKTQNDVVSHYPRSVHEMMSIVSENSPLRYSMLIDYFKKSHNLLIKPENQLFFSSVLFSPLRLSEALKLHPGLKNEYLNFFKEAAEYIDQPTLPLPKDQRSIVRAFICTQQQRFISVLRQMQDPQADILMQNARKEIRELLITDQPEAQILLNLALMESYALDKQITKEDALSLVNASMVVNSLELKNTPRTVMRNEIKASAQAAMRRHIQAIGELIKGSEENLFNPFIKLYGLDPQVHKGWMKDNFPIYFGQISQGILEIDILSGSVKINGRDILFGKVSPSIMAAKEYKRLFGNQVLDVAVTPDYLEANDKYSQIRLVDESYKEDKIYCYRKWNENWYEYMPTQSFPMMQKLPFSKNLDVWLCRDKNSAIKAQIYNNKTQKLEYVIHKDGTMTFAGTDNKRYELLNLPVSLNDFAREALIFREVGTKKVMMVLPFNTNEHHETLIFDLRTIKTATNKQVNEWVLRSDPEYWISPKQVLKGVNHYSAYLILENKDRQQIALIPEISYPLDTKKHSEEIRCLRMQLKHHQLPLQSTSVKNLYTAYLHLCNATAPEDYLKVLEYLEGVREYRRYNEEELKILKWIYDLSTQKPVLRVDHTPESYALRLVALGMVKTNFSTYPRSEGANDEDWSSLVAKPLSQIESFRGYLERKNNIPERMLLENLISPQQLLDWGYQQAVQDIKAQHAQHRKAKLTLFHYDAEILEKSFPLKPNLNLSIEECFAKLPVIRTRRTSDYSDFNYLYRLAESSDLEHQKLVKDIIYQRLYDQSRIKGKTYDALLLLTLIKNDPKHILHSRAVKIFYFFQESKKNDNFYEIKLMFDSFLEEINSEIQSDKFLSKTMHGAPPKKIATVSDKLEVPQSLPDRPRSVEFSYHPRPTLFADLNNMHKTYFKNLSLPKIVHEAPFQVQHPVGKFIQQSIDQLNKDYMAGKENNLKMKSVESLEKPLETAQKIVTTEQEKLSKQLQSNKQELHAKGKEIVKLANYHLKKDPLLRAQVSGLKKEKMTLDDCFLLFLQKDRQRIQKETGITDPAEQDAFYQKIGQYLEISAQTIQLTRVLVEIHKVSEAFRNQDENLVGESLKNLGNILNERHLEPQSINPEAILVFEHKVGIILRDYQIEGLNEMLGHPDNDPMKYADIFLQRIQAGGKTLVWGHLLAHLKADGYHLSMHISPTHQYAANLYDMGERSKYVFSQKERTMIFDDDPIYYKQEYLEATLKTLQEAIRNREYINTTRKSLDALQAQYDKSSLSLGNDPTTNLMENILALMRGRGIFTFDEVHQALDPNHILHIPIGAPVHPDRLQSELVKESLCLAVEATMHDRPLLLLKENKQSQQTEDQKLAMKEAVARGICNNPVWQQIFGIRIGDKVDGKKIREVEGYLLNPEMDLPDYLNQLKQEPGNQDKLVATDYVVLARQLLAGEWLSQALSHGVSEFHGINRKENALPVSIPYLANMVPAYGSEFSDLFVKILHTHIAYLVEGLNTDQTKHFIQTLRAEATAEYESEIEVNPGFVIHETKAVKLFQALCQAEGLDKYCKEQGINLQMFELDVNDPKVIEPIQKGIKGKSSIALDLLLNYVNREVIAHVDIYNYQVSANGQNTACMAKHINGYTASIDNPTMAPVLEAKLDEKGQLARRVKINPQIGTNGQTVDLLLRENNEVWIIPSEPISLFTHLIERLPEEQHIHVRAIIDEGCHFRGVPNHAVAKMILSHLPDPKIKAILFFDQSNGKLSYITKDNPERIMPLKGAKSIFDELQLEPEELFTYYDQDHITGTDIPQMEKAIAIATLNENTRLPNELQQVRRLRKMDYFQRVITAVQEGALQKISHALKDPAIREIREGQVPSKDFIKKLILFAHLNEARKQQNDNPEFCLQQMESLVKQYLRDGIYAKRLDRNLVYSRAKDLFQKNIAINLYKEHAKKKVNISNEEYLKIVREGLLEIAAKVIAPKEVENLRAVLIALEKSSLGGIQEKIEVPPDFAKNAVKALKGNREAVALQRQVNVQTNINVNININIATNINLQMNQAGVAKKERAWSENVLKGKPAEHEVKIVPLNREGLEKFIDPRLFVTDNYLSSLEGGGVDLTSMRRKPIFQMGLMQNEKAEWKVVIGTVKDMWQFAKLIKKDGALPKGHKAWLIRPQGLLAWVGPFPYDAQEMLKNRELVRLLVQVLLLSGNLRELNTPFWSQALKEWMQEMPVERRKEFREFVTKFVFLDQPPKNFDQTTVGHLIAVSA